MGSHQMSHTKKNHKLLFSDKLFWETGVDSSHTYNRIDNYEEALVMTTSKVCLALVGRG